MSPQGFPSEKNCSEGVNFGFVPLFTGQLFIVPEGLLWEDSREATGVRAGMPARRWGSGRDIRQVADSARAAKPFAPVDVARAPGSETKKGRRVKYAPSSKPQEIKKCGYGQGCR